MPDDLIPDGPASKQPEPDDQNPSSYPLDPKERVRRGRQKTKLRGGYGWGALGLAGAQVVAADVGFFIYGYTNAWHIDAQVMDVWLGAAVVQVIGVVTLVTKSIFDPKDETDQ